jgi:hypothetical protein
MQCGGIRYRVNAREQAAARPFRHLVFPRPTTFRLPIQAEKPPIHEIYDALTRDDSRNALIVQNVLNVVRRGRSPLILTERIDHLDILAARLDLRSRTLSCFVVAWGRNNAGLLRIT